MPIFKARSLLALFFRTTDDAGDGTSPNFSEKPGLHRVIAGYVISQPDHPHRIVTGKLLKWQWFLCTGIRRAPTKNCYGSRIQRRRDRPAEMAGVETIEEETIRIRVLWCGSDHTRHRLYRRSRCGRRQQGVAAQIEKSS